MYGPNEITVLVVAVCICRLVQRRFHNHSRADLQKVVEIAGASTLVPEEMFLACDGDLDALEFEPLTDVQLKEDGRYLVIPIASKVGKAIYMAHISL